MSTGDPTLPQEPDLTNVFSLGSPALDLGQFAFVDTYGNRGPQEPVNTEHPLFEPIWQAIKDWDIERTRGRGYAGATGNDVQAIIDAIERGR